MTGAARPLRIVVPIHSFEPGGVERVGLRLAESWVAAGHQVIVALGRAEGHGQVLPAGITCRSYPQPVSTARWETPWMMLTLWRLLRAEQVDVLFCPGNTYTVVAAALRLLLGRRCPPVVAKVSNDLARADMPAPLRWAYRRWLRLHRHFIDWLVAPATGMEAEIAAATGIAPARISTIANPALDGADLARLAALPVRQPGGALHLLAIGRLAPQKNLPLLLRAFAQVAGPDDRLTIAGEGPERARLEALAQQLGLADRLHLPGHCDALDPLLAQANLFALSSDYEGVPSAVIEALAAGLPVVATMCCGSIAALLGHGALGQLVPVGDVAAFGQALARARSLPFDATAARDMAAHYTLGHASARYLALLAEAARQSGTGTGPGTHPAPPPPASCVATTGVACAGAVTR